MNTFPWNFNQNVTSFMQKKLFKKVVWKMSSIYLGFSVLILTCRIQTEHENSDISTTSGQCRQRFRQFRQPPTHYENVKMSNPKMYDFYSVHYIGDIYIDFRTRGLCCVYSRIESVVEAASVGRSKIFCMTPSGNFNAYRNDPELHTVYSLIYFRTFYVIRVNIHHIYFRILPSPW